MFVTIFMYKGRMKPDALLLLNEFDDQWKCSLVCSFDQRPNHGSTPGPHSLLLHSKPKLKPPHNVEKQSLHLHDSKSMPDARTRATHERHQVGRNAGDRLR